MPEAGTCKAHPGSCQRVEDGAPRASLGPVQPWLLSRVGHIRLPVAIQSPGMPAGCWCVWTPAFYPGLTIFNRPNRIIEWSIRLSTAEQLQWHKNNAPVLQENICGKGLKKKPHQAHPIGEHLIPICIILSSAVPNAQGFLGNTLDP